VNLVFGKDEEVGKWVAAQLGMDDEAFYPCTAIGIEKEGKLIAGVVYNNYQPELLIEMSIASLDKRWATRHNIKAFFRYPFIQLGLERVQTLCKAADKGVVMFNKRLGFTPEGYHRKAFHGGHDAISWSMLKPECKWI
jgi:RimJ/RimL family protein N-acetyltransferase